jgi:hypothetical protein
MMGGSVRTVALFLLSCVLTPAVYARDFPKNGNQVLEYCNVMVEVADNPSYFSSLSREAFLEKMEQLAWCAGYLQGTENVYGLTRIHLGMFVKVGLTFDGPERLTQYAADSLRGPCIPGVADAPVLQLARVLVKWLREHPERLHESDIVLTADAFNDSFPCEQATPPPQKGAAQPPTAKP